MSIFIRCPFLARQPMSLIRKKTTSWAHFAKKCPVMSKVLSSIQPAAQVHTSGVKTSASSSEGNDFSVNLKFYKNMTEATLPSGGQCNTTTSASDMENAKEQIKSLIKTAEDMKERIKELEKHSDSPNEIEDLKEKVTTLLTQADKLMTLQDKVEEEIEQLKKEIKELKDRVEHLESTMKNLELGQMMTALSGNVSKFILQPEVAVGDNCSLKYMLDILHKGANKKIDKRSRKMLKRQWEDFQSSSDITWTNEHWDAMKEIKVKRNKETHPQHIDYNQVTEQAQKLYIHWESECLDIIEIHRKINSLLVLGFISGEFQKEVVSFVLPGRDDTNISELTEWIRRNKSTIQGEAANQRWNMLANGKIWSNNHEMVLEEMKELRRDKTILQEIEFDNEAKRHIADYVSSELNEMCSDIIDMMKTLPTLSKKPWKLPENK